MSSKAAAHAHNHDGKYIKIYLILLGLLIVSILGPELGNTFITLITAFGIAIVKAYMVCAYFMHLNVEKKIIWYMMIISLVLVFVFYFGTAPDIQKADGHQWADCVADASCVSKGNPAVDSINYGIIRE